MTIEPNCELAPTISDTKVQGNSLLEAIVSNELSLNYAYLPVRPLEPENLNIGTTKFPLVDSDQDDDQSDEQLLRTIDGLLDKLVIAVNPTKIPSSNPNKAPDRVFYL